MNSLYGFVERDVERPSSAPDCDIYDMKQAAVLHAIRTTVDKANRATINSMDNPKTAYNTLVSQHGADNGLTTANTLTELSSATYDPSTLMNTYLARIQDLHSRVQDLTSGDPDLKISEKLFVVVLINSVPRAKYGTIVQQLLANIKTLSIAQATACLRLKSVSMASDEASFKDVYAVKITKTNKRKVGKNHDDLCHVHPNGRHANSSCFQQQANKTAASVSSQQSLSDEQIVKRYRTLFTQSHSQSDKPAPKTAAVASTSESIPEEA